MRRSKAAGHHRTAKAVRLGWVLLSAFTLRPCLKSFDFRVDVEFMAFSLATILEPGNLWFAVLLVAGWLVLMCLKAIGHEIDHAVRWHNLRIEAHELRIKQMQRLKALGLKSRR